MSEGRIIKGIGGIYTLIDLVTSEYINASVRGKLRYTVVSKDSSFNKQLTYKKKLETKTIKISPKVGDYVFYQKTSDGAIIEEIKPRVNDLDRPSIANIDQVLLIFAAKRPDFQNILLDQFLALMEKANIKVKIIISKVDLLSEIEFFSLKEELDYYKAIGYDVYFVNSKDKTTLNEVKDLFKGKISVLSGQTGAGKSTFVNALIPGFNLKTQEISDALGRGKHTTTATELYEFNEGFIGDTPGFSKLDFALFEEQELKNYFIDFPNGCCKYRGCMHDKEPDCCVKELVLNGKIKASRYENYLHFLEGIKNNIKKY